MGVPWPFLTVHRGSKVGTYVRPSVHFHPPPFNLRSATFREDSVAQALVLSAGALSEGQRAVPEGVLVPKEGWLTARRFFRHRVRAVHSIWQTERPFQQASLTTPHRDRKNTRTVGHPSLGTKTPSATVRAHRRGHWRRPAAAVARTQRLAWASTQNSTTRRRTELVVDRAPLPVIRPS